ncbi:hypothetical protein SMC00_002668 [Cronobacter sakazakii]|nr:hypothetical protein [Cronobacter sakazakii]ELY2759882.1 hypothetical protein [Cronobacter sakazakii]ELY3999522.1 hypothetical protein [Cronobacter sakazakii]ELY4068970.1 hypothetical protein [Cronobacter sakazakii]ELY4094894.1 hypothetical protein [Cronobacter sakazakii]
MKNKKIELLLEGRTLLKEVACSDSGKRKWIELSLQDNLKPAYPFRTEPYAMLGHSQYANKCNIEDAKFKMRISIFAAEDIENGYDPSYDEVGDYEYFDSIAELEEKLVDLNVNLECFIDSSDDDEYPL